MMGFGGPSSPYRFAEKPVFRRPVVVAISIVISSSVMKTPDFSNVDLVGVCGASNVSEFESVVSTLTDTKSSVGVS